MILNCFEKDVTHEKQILRRQNNLCNIRNNVFTTWGFRLKCQWDWLFQIYKWAGQITGSQSYVIEHCIKRIRKIKVKAKQSHYRPQQTLRTSGGWEFLRISRHSAREGGNVVSPTHRPPLHPKRLKNSNDSIGNRTRALSSCSTVCTPLKRIKQMRFQDSLKATNNIVLFHYFREWLWS